LQRLGVGFGSSDDDGNTQGIFLENIHIHLDQLKIGLLLKAYLNMMARLTYL